MKLQNSTWPEVEAYLSKSTGILIPIGSTEQHGPNGLIGTDAICPEVIAEGVASQEQVLLAPTINFGMAQHHLGFPGTIALRPSTLLHLIYDVIESLAIHGFRYLYFLNGHGGNSATVNAAFSEFYANRSFAAKDKLSMVYTRLCNWWMLPQVSALASELYGNQEGSHATPSEVSLSFFARPDSVKSAKLTPTVARSDTFYEAADYRNRFADGRMGSNPALASIEHGKRFYECAVSDVKKDYQRFCQTLESTKV